MNESGRGTYYDRYGYACKPTARLNPALYKPKVDKTIPPSECERQLRMFFNMTLIDCFEHQEIREAVEQVEVKEINAQYFERHGKELGEAQLFFLAGLNDKGLNHYRKLLGLRVKE
ncbi:hypothetical protein ACFQ5D_09150 [Paenibacillus farraposensis]|uniref:Uncharacterized protein n=1 Tax=Paenibacillus farraposensis TaxID=2807095 RepID=A0ABW4DCL5_9BACL|nr:hypothetical protein [Paenibacillus farraposensis]MCC3379914.1 hypothetical protein [Paenibacillus farraposensis]